MQRLKIVVSRSPEGVTRKTCTSRNYSPRSEVERGCRCLVLTTRFLAEFTLSEANVLEMTHEDWYGNR
jgi:hypothetical protein